MVVELMGPFAVLADGQSVTFEARTAAALVALVALARGRPLAREAVAASLWPDHDLASARTNLRKALQRVRKATGGFELIVAEDDALRLGAVETDLEQADRLHRTYLLAARQPQGVHALAQEWELRRRLLLEGWDDDWIGDYRVQASLAANDIGSELALAYESTGDADAALGVWRAILERVPHHAQALQNALRLEIQVHGRGGAAELARNARMVFREDLGIEMPLELRKAIRDARSGGHEPVPPPAYLRKRSELYLLARMFESNLENNRTEALSFLAQECTVAKALAHPSAMLSLLNLALERTDGDSPERVAVASLAATVASWASQFEIGHRWSDFVVASLPPEDPLHGRTLSMKGFMLFEQREYVQARQTVERAVEIFDRLGLRDDAARARIARAAVHWHLQEFEEAIELYQAALDQCGDRNDEIASLMRASANSNLCFVYVTMERWAEAIPYGRLGLSYADEHPVFGWIIPGTLGLALFRNGEAAEGIRLIVRALVCTLREGMPRFNQIVVDYAAVVLHRSGKERAALCLLQANAEHRVSIRHHRSPAEAGLLEASGLSVSAPLMKDNPLLGQSAATLSEWAVEELERLAENLEAPLTAAGQPL